MRVSRGRVQQWVFFYQGRGHHYDFDCFSIYHNTDSQVQKLNTHLFRKDEIKHNCNYIGKNKIHDYFQA